MMYQLFTFLNFFILIQQLKEELAFSASIKQIKNFGFFNLFTYFKTLGPDKDYTFKPTIFEKKQ